eukprot:10094231-Ditylum_brightwellii.AAC.1
MVAGEHLEIDDSVVLGDEDHQNYQMLIGMLNWIVLLGWININYSVSSLDCFVACPQQGHKDRALYVFGYLKKKPNQRIVINSCDPIVMKNGAEGQLETDFLAKMKE